MLEAEHIKLAAATWIKVRGEQIMPKASQYGPFEMRPFLPHVAVFRRTGEDQYKVSLQGTALVEAFGFDATGKDITAVYSGDAVSELHDLYRLIFSGSYLSHSKRVHKRKSGTAFTVEQLLLPLSNEDGVHDRCVLLACNVPVPRRPRLDKGEPPKLGTLQQRTIYDPRTLLPVECFATTPRDPEAMTVPIIEVQH